MSEIPVMYVMRCDGDTSDADYTGVRKYLTSTGSEYRIVGPLAEAISIAITAAIETEKERCAKVADEIMTTADGKFDLRVLRAMQGENNLELAAACAAGMSHAAREIATTIRGGSHE